MAKIIYIDDILKKREKELSTSQTKINKKNRLQPVIDSKTQELLGYTVRFPLPDEAYGKNLPSNVFEINKPKNNRILIPKYDEEFSGHYVLDVNKKFIGTVYDHNSNSQEFKDDGVDGVMLLYLSNSLKIVGINSKYGVKVNYTKINEYDPAKLLLKEYELNIKKSN